MLSAGATHESAPRLCLPSEGAQDKRGRRRAERRFPEPPAPGVSLREPAGCALAPGGKRGNSRSSRVRSGQRRGFCSRLHRAQGRAGRGVRGGLAAPAIRPREKASQEVGFGGLRPYGSTHGAANPVSVRNTRVPAATFGLGPLDEQTGGSSRSGCCGKPRAEPAAGGTDVLSRGSRGCGSEVPALGDGAPGRSGPSCPPLREGSSLSSALPKGTDPV